MKKYVVLIMLLFLIPPIVMASGLFKLGFGSINQFQLPIPSPGIQQASLIDVRNWATGGELRARVLGINIDSYLLIQQGKIIDVTEQGKAVFEDDIAQRLFGMVGVGLSTKVAEFTTLSLAAGTLVGLDVSSGFDVRLWMGTTDNYFSRERSAEFFANTTVAYRMRFDFNLGGFSVGLHYQVPSLGFSYANPEAALLEPDWGQGKIGASFITTFF